MSRLYLGRVHRLAGRPDRALAPLRQAIAGFESLGDDHLGNLSAALGSLANTLRALGRLDEALEAAERGLDIDRKLGSHREEAAGLGQKASILVAQQRYAEADATYDEALAAARAAGDLELQGTTLQHQAGLQDNQGYHDRAVTLYQQALDLFRQARDEGSEMRTADLLGSAELRRGQLDAAEAWYARARELAERLKEKDRNQLAVIAQNVGILHQSRAEQTGDPAQRAASLRKAVASTKESLAIKLENEDRVGAASSYSQLGILHRMLGELDEAERNAREALVIREALNLPDVWKVYDNLAEIARARGDEAAAAEWQAKSDAKLAELERLRRGGAAGDEVGEDLVKFVLALAQGAFNARASGALAPEVAEALAQIAGAPAPFDALGSFLQKIAGREPLPPVPAGLPAELGKIVEALAEAIRRAG